MLDLELSPDLAEIARAAAAVDDFCAAQGLPLRVAFDINLAVDELMTNAISYGFADPAETGRIHLRLELTGDGWIEVELADNGAAYNPFDEAPPPVLTGDIDDRPIGGLGVYLVRQLMDEVGYRREDGWNRVTLRRRPQRGAQGQAGDGAD